LYVLHITFKKVTVKATDIKLQKIYIHMNALNVSVSLIASVAREVALSSL